MQGRKSKSDIPKKDTELSKKALHLLPKSSASFTQKLRIFLANGTELFFRSTWSCGILNFKGRFNTSIFLDVS